LIYLNAAPSLNGLYLASLPELRTYDCKPNGRVTATEAEEPRERRDCLLLKSRCFSRLSQMTKLVDEFIVDWKPIDTVPFGRDVELAVINSDGKHALVFPCRRTIDGWVNAVTKKQLYFILPTHWRVWVA
jgi:hypothetical protein